MHLLQKPNSIATFGDLFLCYGVSISHLLLKNNHNFLYGFFFHLLKLLFTAWMLLITTIFDIPLGMRVGKGSSGTPADIGCSMKPNNIFQLVQHCANNDEYSTFFCASTALPSVNTCLRIASFPRLVLTQISSAVFHRYLGNAALAC